MDANATSDRSILHKTLLRRYRLLQCYCKDAVSYLPHAPCRMSILLTSVKRQICTVIYSFQYNGHYIILLAVTPKRTAFFPLSVYGSGPQNMFGMKRLPRAGEIEILSNLYLNSTLFRGDWSTSCFDCFTSGKKPDTH
jgi:hypothetical protein